MKILYYISSHGFGHAARAGQVIRELIKDHTVYIKSMAPKWLLQQVIGCEPLLFPRQYDTGCLQLTNMDVDIDGTIKRYLEQSENNNSCINEEISFISDNKINVIVSDIASFPFVVAKKASLPSLFIGNFTWKGIYQLYLKNDSHPVIQELTGQYGMADQSLITPMAMDMPELNNRKKINLIARRGKNIRDELNQKFNIPEKNKLVFFYAGNLGAGNVRSGLIGDIPDHTFISFYPIDSPPANYIYLENGSYPHHDVMSSSDLAMIKPGYGMISEALVNKVQIIYPPREDFAEYFAFKKEFEISGGSLLIRRDDFEKGNWQNSLSQIEDKKYNKNYSSNGAEECKKIIERF